MKNVETGIKSKKATPEKNRLDRLLSWMVRAHFSGKHEERMDECLWIFFNERLHEPSERNPQVLPCSFPPCFSFITGWKWSWALSTHLLCLVSPTRFWHTREHMGWVGTVLQQIFCIAFANSLLMPCRPEKHWTRWCFEVPFHLAFYEPINLSELLKCFIY